MALPNPDWHTLQQAANICFPKQTGTRAYQLLMQQIDSGQLTLSVELYNQPVCLEKTFLSEEPLDCSLVSGHFAVVIDDSPHNTGLRQWIRQEAKAGAGSSSKKLIPIYCILLNGKRHIVIYPEIEQYEEDDYYETIPLIAQSKIPASRLVIMDEDLKAFLNTPPAESQPVKPVDATKPTTDNTREKEPEQFLKLPEVLSRLSIGKTKLYKDINSGLFPAPIKMGGSSMWKESDIDRFMKELGKKEKD